MENPGYCNFYFEADASHVLHFQGLMDFPSNPLVHIIRKLLLCRNL